MNAKKCKRLRRWAEALTVGQPAVAYQDHPKAKTQRIVTLGDRITVGLMVGKWINRVRTAEFADKITRRLEPTCTRAIYQGMKDSQRRAARGE
jgi:hypothetical protein